MTCLLCHQEFPQNQNFCDLFFFRQSSRAVCPTCCRQFEKIGQWHCPMCCRPGSDQVCQDCQIWQNKGHKVNHRALYHYNSAMKDYFSTFKFQGDYLLCQVFAKELSKALKSYKSYTIVPVPLSKERFQERQFNQVTAMLDAAHISYQNLLIKADVGQQSAKSRGERLSASSPFQLKKKTNLPQKILLVDDIYTTGATLQGISQLLFEHNVETIKTFSLAR